MQTIHVPLAPHYPLHFNGCSHKPSTHILPPSNLISYPSSFHPSPCNPYAHTHRSCQHTSQTDQPMHPLQHTNQSPSTPHTSTTSKSPNSMTTNIHTEIINQFIQPTYTQKSAFIKHIQPSPLLIPTICTISVKFIVYTTVQVVLPWPPQNTPPLRKFTFPTSSLSTSITPLPDTFSPLALLSSLTLRR